MMPEMPDFGDRARRKRVGIADSQAFELKAKIDAA